VTLRLGRLKDTLPVQASTCVYASSSDRSSPQVWNRAIALDRPGGSDGWRKHERAASLTASSTPSNQYPGSSSGRRKRRTGARPRCKTSRVTSRRLCNRNPRERPAYMGRLASLWRSVGLSDCWLDVSIIRVSGCLSPRSVAQQRPTGPEAARGGDLPCPRCAGQGGWDAAGMYSGAMYVPMMTDPARRGPGAKDTGPTPGPLHRALCAASSNVGC
jgi:hypothetical protein